MWREVASYGERDAPRGRRRRRQAQPGCVCGGGEMRELMRLVVAAGGDQRRRGSGEAAPDETAFEEAPLREEARDATPGEEERAGSHHHRHFLWQLACCGQPDAGGPAVRSADASTATEDSRLEKRAGRRSRGGRRRRPSQLPHAGQAGEGEAARAAPTLRCE